MSSIKFVPVLLLAMTSSSMAIADTAAFTPDANMPRSSVPDKYKWNLSPLFKNDAAFETALKSAQRSLGQLERYQGKLADPKQLQACLKQYFEARLATNKLTLYANLRLDTEQKDNTAQSMNERSLQLMNELMSKASFIRQEILALSADAMKAAYAAQPKLEEYKPYIEQMRRRRDRVLDAQAERVLSLAGDNLWAEIDLNEIPSDFEKTFDAALNDIPLPSIKDEQGKDVQLTLSSYPKFRGSSDRRVRRDAVEAFFATLNTYQHVFASTLAGQIRYNVFLARSRGYDTALEAYLDKDDIDAAVYRNLVRSIRSNLRPLHRYITLRKQVLGVDEVHIYDLYTPLVPSVEMHFSYEDAERILPTVLEPLGDEYVDVLKKGLSPKQGWIDVYPHQDKGSGAFSASVYGLSPYVKMNYFNGVDDLSTLAHEYGHAMHSYLAMRNQPYVTASYVPFIAEIASTFNQKLLSDYLVANAKTDDEKLYILADLVETIRTTIYRQALFAEFELEVHTAAEKGTPITAEFLRGLYGRLIKAYYGPSFSVGPNDDMEWAYIPHFYYKYYVFTYATGLSSGIALAERVKRYGKGARNEYLDMLKGGSSKPPLELLKTAGVDLTKPEAIAAAARLMNSTIAEMEKLLAKKKK